MGRIGISPVRLLLLSGLSSAFLFSSGCSDEPSTTPSVPPAVSVVVLETAEVRPSKEFVARTAASVRADIIPRIEGEIREVLFKEGAKVSEGQVLVRLEDTRANADLQQTKAELTAASAELESASRNFKRGNELAGTGFLSGADLDKLRDRLNAADSRVKSAKAAVQKADTNLDYAEIRAPFDGWVRQLRYDVGSVVGPSSGPITSVLVTDPIYVEFQLNEADFIAIRRAGAQAASEAAQSLNFYLTLPDGERFGQFGALDFADAETDASTGTVAMRAVFPNPSSILVPGLYVTLHIEGQAGEGRVLVPKTAIQETIEGKFVLVVDEQNEVAQRFIQTGRRTGAMLAVQSGVEQGDRVIVEGLQKVRPGATVSPVEKQVDSETGALSTAGDSGQ